jgi:hypothetical protein
LLGVIFRLNRGTVGGLATSNRSATLSKVKKKLGRLVKLNVLQALEGDTH